MSDVNKTGSLAESAVCKRLEKQGFKIIARNWKTRWCEIDIIASRSKTIYFVEVKYRKTNMQGTGLEYITPRKLDQMRFAAEIWINSNKNESDYALLAVEVSGTDYSQIKIVEC